MPLLSAYTLSRRSFFRSLILAAVAAACLAPYPAAAEPERPAIYQLFVRLFSNTHETRKVNGTMEDNGVGTFRGINDAALTSLRDLGITHIWLTGVIEHASGTSFPGRPADEPDILKGIAGSPYAIRDYFAVAPDLAEEPNRRLEEFRELLERCRRHGFKVLIDFVPNHVARSYQSTERPALSFGENDDRSVFFARDNHFFYLNEEHPGDGPPLRLPTAHLPGADGLFAPETDFGRVTGDDAITWAPGVDNWYETVKLNYGHDFTTGRDTSHLPGPEASPQEVPDTWRKMDEILAYWQEMGVDGFRVDMAHMVPMEFWRWALARARNRNPDAFFVAEAYDDDPKKITDGNVLEALLDAGFDAVYDDPSYDLLEEIYDGPRWANDLEWVARDDSPLFHRSLRYAENHDEVRLANPNTWGGLGMEVGRPVTALLFGLGRGPVMIYNGQEVGEPAVGESGFSGDDARTTIFDYWSMPEFTKWCNNRTYNDEFLSEAQRDLRAFYGRLLHAVRHPAFVRGAFRPLNPHNVENHEYGRIGDAGASGHWIYSYLRHCPESGEAPVLVVVNLNGTETMRNVRVRIPQEDIEWAGLAGATSLRLRNLLGEDDERLADATFPDDAGIPLGDLPPCSAFYFEMSAE